MKKYIILLICILAYTADAGAQSPSEKEVNSTQDSNVVYKLYSTANMWTFIKLNTRNGLMWQVQYTIEEDSNYRFETYLNFRPLVNKEEESNNRFILHPTANSYNFILLDQIAGQTWQVQWSQDPEQRLVIPIK